MPDDDYGEIETIEISRYRDRIVEGPIVKTFLWLALPPLVNQLVVMAYDVADTYWISLYSEVAVSVPRQIWPVTMIFQALLRALTTASLSIVSQYIGGKMYRKASLEASRFFTLSFFAGALSCLTLLTLRYQIFTVIVSTPKEIFEYVMEYSAIISFDIFLIYLSLTYTTLLQSVGDTRRPAIINTLSVLLNIVLDPFLVLGIGPFPRLGVAGAALTDVIGMVVSVSSLHYMLRKRYPEIKLGFTKDISREWILLVLKIGLPILALALTNGFAFLMQVKIVNLLGIVAVTAYSVGFVVVNIVDAALWGLSGATSIMVGQSLGAGKRERALEVAYKSTALIFASMALGAIAIYPMRGGIAGVFVRDLRIIDETERFLQLLLPTIPFFGVFMNSMSIGRGSGNTTVPTAIGIMRHWVIRVLLGYLLAFIFGMGSYGFWLAISLSNVVGGILSFLWMKYGNWAKTVVENE
ncbi:MAG: MATE family efflux transporter [Candidatus Asgardarchaeia archaeon]